MTVVHRGHTIDVHRAKSLGGDTLLYFSIFRDADHYECESGFTSSADTVRDYVRFMRERIDAELLEADPWCEHAEATHPFDAEIEP